ncbi:nucleoside triphosphate pyrophosphohydrolase family protein [Variovorax paradoxus]|uniref:nucleoside triphosphate pyrophosphohydrolase family protein n=1 Tax=Variovorax paradoxus TaxID=34073 RepID=UPI0021AC492E|nr:nucleoside triphosphate pyrophosphohydrolase family protein [Variovorax paradoxus]UVH57187.1 nucleoside triphosphate pyrophosphohydrolase family protein [Variovorax paradoxus]
MAPLSIKPVPLSLVEYTAKALETDRFGQEQDGLTQLGFGLFGEVGGLLAALKKASRDKLQNSKAFVAGEEIGDALWYLVVLAHHGKVAPDQLGEAAMSNLREKLGEGPHRRNGGMTFEELDSLAELHYASHHEKREMLLREVAFAAGTFTQAPEADYVTWTADRVATTLGRLLGQLTMVARSFGLDLASIARDNLDKIKARWPGDQQPAPYVPLFDDTGFSKYEQLPRGDFKIDFIPRVVRGRDLVVQQWNGVNIGDPLTDNSNVPDWYRYHDVFHLAYMAHLGWSPVLRALLKLKRKSRPDIDENQDGARAIIIEEGIATWIFNHAKERGDDFADVEAGKLDFNLLKQVQTMVRGYEVHTCPPWQWELAILDGFKMFRALKAASQGAVIVNIEQHSIKFEGLSAPKEST